MRLDMRTRKKICGKIYRRYQKAGKKEKGRQNISPAHIPVRRGIIFNFSGQGKKILHLFHGKIHRFNQMSSLQHYASLPERKKTALRAVQLKTNTKNPPIRRQIFKSVSLRLLTKFLIKVYYTKNVHLFKYPNCVKTFLAERGMCLKTKNLAQIKRTPKGTMVPTMHGGTNEVRYAHQEKDMRKDLPQVPEGREKRKGGNA